jgi:hypothetical protein
MYIYFYMRENIRFLVFCLLYFFKSHYFKAYHLHHSQSQQLIKAHSAGMGPVLPHGLTSLRRARLMLFPTPSTCMERGAQLP